MASPSLNPWTASTAGSTSQTRPATQAASTPIISTVSTTTPASTTNMSPTYSSSVTPVSSSAWTSSSPSTKPSTIQPTMNVVTTDACPTHMGMVAAGFWASSDQWCFQFVHVLESWQVAEHMCNIQGGHLVTIENAQKEQFITSLLKAHGLFSNFWIGLNDQMREAYFQWSSGIDAHYNNFESLHTHPFADCVYLSAATGKWHESHCTIARHYYICQFNKNMYHGVPIIG
ncbi:snaclec bothroinsularin subunit beta-like [Mya arenaria]|uniref:snaclec bothroinsularin subunit beta-like n=1 Tax=Mya arenaria TaxID=6604 RepID=UPI0022E39673|nr:snaclec bothroinsularin subunit beta-like [Mya arenaria]